MRLFVSCVSAEFRSYRLRLANQLGALRGEPVHVIVQEDFQQGGYELLRSLADTIKACDRVVHLVGDAAGWCPTPEHERALLDYLGEPASEPTPGFSYTQWEYRLARRFKKPVLVYRATAEAPRDCGPTVDQDDAAAALQKAHIAALEQSGEHWTDMTSAFQLVREVCRDLGRIGDLRIDNLPYDSIGSLFKGRDEFMKKLREVLGEYKHTRHSRAAVIVSKEEERRSEDGKSTKATLHGLGGVGKTRAAIEYGRRHAEEFTALLFVRADSKAELDRNLAALCGPAVFNLPEQSETETEKQVAAALRWLRAHPGWFLVFDNVDTEEAAKEVETHLGQLGAAGQVIITSRLANWRADVTPLEIDVLDLDAAVEFLLERTDEKRRKLANDEALARELAELLGQLALALEQAGAMIAHQRLTFAQYLEQWHTRQTRVLEWFDERAMKYPKSVAVTWQTSFDQLTPLAQRLLSLVSWYAPAPIPESLLAVPIPDENIDPHDLRNALANLEQFSLARRSAEAATPTFTVHRVVQDVVRINQAEGSIELEVALRWIDQSIVNDADDVRNWPILDPLAPHVQHCVTWGSEAGIGEPTSRLMHQLALLMKGQARFVEAEGLMRESLAKAELIYGSQHPRIASTVGNLGGLLHEIDRLAEAEPYLRRALEIDLAHYGEKHPRFAIRLNNLAMLLEAANRYEEAERLLRRAATIESLVDDEDRSSLARYIGNLAHVMQSANRTREAEPLMREALAIDEAFYGEYHPYVALRLNNLANLLKETNRRTEAEPLMRRALAIDEASLGEKHPSVARDLGNLAVLLQETKRTLEAEALSRRALAIDEACLGENHFSVGIRINNLAQLLQDSGDLGEAELLMRRAVQVFERSRGVGHPSVAAAVSNLAMLLLEDGRPAEAEPLMRRALAIDEAALGRDHPSVATALNNLASLLFETERLTEAETLMRRNLTILCKFQNTSGYQHPNLNAAVSNYGTLLMGMGHTQAEATAAIRAIFDEVAAERG